MSPRLHVAGVITAMVTPFDKVGRPSLSMLEQLTTLQLRAGVDGVLICGGSGEYASLSAEERVEVTRAAIRAANSRILVVAGVLEASTAKACEAARLLGDTGPSALMVLTPYYFNPSPDGIRAHFEAVAASTPLPIIIYNNPGRTGINISPELLSQLASIESVIGIKECDRDLGRVTQKIEAVGDKIDFLAGDDDLVLPMFAVGACGGIMASASLAPEWAVRMVAAIRAGNRKESLDYHRRITRLLYLFYRPNHPGPLKQALEHLGWNVGPARPPLASLSEDQLRELAAALDELGLTKRDEYSLVR